MIKVTANLEGNDREFYEEVAAEQAGLGKWEIGEQTALCSMGEMTVERLSEVFGGWGDELTADEKQDIENMVVGEVIEIERGRGCWYEVERTE